MNIKNLSPFFYIFKATVVVLFLTTTMAFGFDVPKLTGPVVDQAGLLSSQEIFQLDSQIRGFKQQTSVQLQILILSTLNNESIEGVAIQVFDKWKLGSEKKDDGILILVALNDRKMRIEVGQGLEGAVPDIYAKRIVSEIMRPNFQNRNFLLGLQQCVIALQELILKGEAGNLAPEPEQKSELSFPMILIIMFLIFFFFIRPALFGMNRRGYRSSGWGGGWPGGGGGGFGGGGGWSGGGGSSSGGGASGGW